MLADTQSSNKQVCNCQLIYQVLRSLVVRALYIARLARAIGLKSRLRPLTTCYIVCTKSLSFPITEKDIYLTRLAGAWLSVTVILVPLAQWLEQWHGSPGDLCSSAGGLSTFHILQPLNIVHTKSNLHRSVAMSV